MAEGFTPAEDFTPAKDFTRADDDPIFDDYDDPSNYNIVDDGIIYDAKPVEIEMKYPDGWEIKDGFLVPPEKETSFVDNLPDTPGTPMSLEKQEKTHHLNMELYLK